MKLNDSEITGAPSAKTALEQKYFTLTEANAALPLVRRIVQDIVDQYKIVMDLHEQLQRLDDTASEEELKEIESPRHAATIRLNDLVAELSEIGCELKDWESGLVDFPTRRQGRDQYLCWKLGEQKVAFWHELHLGFSARKPVTEHENP